MRDTSKEKSGISGEVRSQLVATGVDYLEPKTVYEVKQGDVWDQGHQTIKDEVKASQDNEIWDLVRSNTGTRHTGQMGLQSEIEPVVWSTNSKNAIWRNALKSGRTGLFRLLRLPTFKILLQPAAKQGHVIYQIDVKTAFLPSAMEEVVHLEQPQENMERE